jgi:hypothetical protein
VSPAGVAVSAETNRARSSSVDHRCRSSVSIWVGDVATCIRSFSAASPPAITAIVEKAAMLNAIAVLTCAPPRVIGCRSSL